MSWRIIAQFTAFNWFFASPHVSVNSHRMAIKDKFGAVFLIELVIHSLFYDVLWFFLRLFFHVDRSEKAEKDLVMVKQKVAELIQGREHQLPELSASIIKIFRRHRFKVIEHSEQGIVFRHRFEESERVTMQLK